MIRISNLCKKFGSSVIFENVNLEIDKCGIYAFVGESGSGKSTLLNMLAGYEKLSSGSLEAEGKIATIFQNYELIQELNVHDNVFLPLEIWNEVYEEADMIVSILGLEPLLSRYPSELSGGQQQRVGIARALFQKPDIILCDEPTESLDRENKEVVMNLLKKLSEHCIVILVSHDMKIVNEYADVIYKLEHHDIVLSKNTSLQHEALLGKEASVNSSKVKQYLNKILVKKTVLFALLISILTVCWLSLFSVSKDLFQEPTTFDTLMKNSVFITTQKEDYDFSQVGVSALPRIYFTSIEYDLEHYRALISPYKKNTLPLTGKEPEGLEVVFNQNMAARFDKDMVGETIILNYRIGWLDREIESTIVGIIEEADIDAPAIYYNLDGVNAELDKRLAFNDPLNRTEKQVVEEGSLFWELVTPYENMPNVYEKLGSDGSLLFESPLYDKRVEEKRQSSMYELVFNIVQWLLLVGIIVVILVFGSIDTKHYLKNCSLFITLGVSVESVKRVYMNTKLSCFTVLFGMLLVIQQLVYKNVSSYVLKENEMTLAILCIAAIYIVYVGIYSISIQQLKKDKINQSLKDMGE